ncbi:MULTISPECIES: DEAD/DEAH box helicase family protein [Rhodomicrobium]|uniref:DEAD/DEAH box helicase family protein n=1 Tax=Rhodomicrobium TaxID=1068 RepID=UPI000B4BACB0|nr:MULTISPECIES: DEAD/DEAH box helicase family protein [Rhodomicrobium]
MSLRDILYQDDYRSGYDNIVEDFFRPSLREAELYWRAVGYFSSSALEAFGAPLGEFIKKGGLIRLVTSVELSEGDLRAIENGAVRQDICARRLEQIIETDFADGVGDGVARLARLLEMGRLEVQIAIPKTGAGIYHEKIGLFIDGEDYVAFTGSSNESRNAFENNRECVDVYSSWGSTIRAARKREHFEALWNRADKGVEVYSFPEAAQKKLLRVCGEWEAGRRQTQQQSQKWRHQDEAVATFLAAERGVLNMATGTGKTRTAMKILQALVERDEIDTVIVCTDGNDLLDQWYSELLAVRKTIGRDLRVFRHYRDMKETQGFVLDPRNAILLVSREPVASALRQLGRNQARRALLIHDEVHGLGSPGNRTRLASLSDNVRFRLGLSATPEREYDHEGNAFIEDHIGPVLMTFGLREAIARGILAPFNYYPLHFALTDADRERIAAIYRRRKAREAAGNPMSDTELWIEIARVYKTSEAKLPVFTNFIKNHEDLLRRCIIFTETMEYGDAVLDIVHKYRPDFHTYYSGEQAETLRKFARGDLECLITCHRLSEGIDIKSLSTVILFSSERARLETIQRIGRCLRTNPDNPQKIANIVDFIREGGEHDDPNADEQRRDWLTDLSTLRPAE